MTDRYKELMDNIPGVFYRCACDEHFTMYHMSAGIQTLTGYSIDDIVQNKTISFASLIHPDDIDMVVSAVDIAVEQQKPWDVEYRLRRKDNTYVWVSEQGIGAYDESKNMHFLDGFVADISQRKSFEAALQQSEQRIRDLAFYDSITGLPNRNLIYERIESSLVKASQQNQVGLLYIDLDGFKVINDTRGHSVGDEMLAITGRRLSELVGENEIAARVGGDEFMILCTNNASYESCQDLATQVVKSLSQPVEIKGDICQIGASVGISLSGQGSETVHNFVMAADSAMFLAKRAGGNLIETSTGSFPLQKSA